MTLRLRTAPYTDRSDDRVDITRVGVDRAIAKDDPAPGSIFAPSSRILWPAMQHLDLVAALTRRSDALGASEAGAAVAMMAFALLVKTETAYRNLYTAEMRASYRSNRAAWDAFLARETATVVCFCPRRDPGDGQRHTCHRGHLAAILAKCGAVDAGEVVWDREPVDPHRLHRLPELHLLVAVSGTRPPKPGATMVQQAEYDRLASAAEDTVDGLPPGTVVVHGGAAGIDTVAEQASRRRGLKTWVVRPWYDAWGNVSPKVRNVYVAMAHKVYAFPSSYGTGTQNACEIARQAGCDLEIRSA